MQGGDVVAEHRAEMRTVAFDQFRQRDLGAPAFPARPRQIGHQRQCAAERRAEQAHLDRIARRDAFERQQQHEHAGSASSRRCRSSPAPACGTPCTAPPAAAASAPRRRSRSARSPWSATSRRRCRPRATGRSSRCRRSPASARSRPSSGSSSRAGWPARVRRRPPGPGTRRSGSRGGTRPRKSSGWRAMFASALRGAQCRGRRASAPSARSSPRLPAQSAVAHQRAQLAGEALRARRGDRSMRRSRALWLVVAAACQRGDARTEGSDFLFGPERLFRRAHGLRQCFRIVSALSRTSSMRRRTSAVFDRGCPGRPVPAVRDACVRRLGDDAE